MDDLLSRYCAATGNVGTLDELCWMLGSDVVLEHLVDDVLEDCALVREMGVGWVGTVGHHDLTNERIRVYRSAPAEVSLMMFLSG